MNNTFSLKQTTKTGILDYNLIKHHYKLDLNAWLMKIKSANPGL